jgi:hypothetical protein
VANGRVTQWAVIRYSNSTGADQYEFGDFTYGEIDLSRLRHVCERAGSDFFELYSDQLRGRRTFCRDRREIGAVYIDTVARMLEVSPCPYHIIHRLLDDYHNELAAAEMSDFIDSMVRQEAVFAAGGLETASKGAFRYVWPFLHWITAFNRSQRKEGWVVTSQGSVELRSADPLVLSNRQRVVRDALKLEDWGKRPLDDKLQVYCEYLAAARNHQNEGRLEEALLHVVFGLDVLLGGKSDDALTHVFSGRGAVLSHLALGMSIDQVEKFLKECYDMRSGYVHRGEMGKLGASAVLDEKARRLEQLLDCARAVLGAACFARLQPWCQSDDPRKAWLIGRVDVVRKKLEAGITDVDSDLKELGLDAVQLNSDAGTVVRIN